MRQTAVLPFRRFCPPASETLVQIRGGSARAEGHGPERDFRGLASDQISETRVTPPSEETEIPKRIGFGTSPSPALLACNM